MTQLKTTASKIVLKTNVDGEIQQPRYENAMKLYDSPVIVIINGTRIATAAKYLYIWNTLMEAKADARVMSSSRIVVKLVVQIVADMPAK
jgi:hypothetical protein